MTVKGLREGLSVDGIRTYAVQQILRNPASLVVNGIQSLAIFLREHPGVVVTTGAGDALPTVFFAALLGVPIVFAESLARVRSPSLFGRVVSHWCDLIMVQWPDMLQVYPRAVYVRPLFRWRQRSAQPPRLPSVIVLTGTHVKGFDSLLQALDSLIGCGQLHAEVFAQVGHSEYLPLYYPYQSFLPHRELLDRVRAADIVITHDGSASISEALEAGKPVIVVPRKRARGEVAYGSRSELAVRLAQLRWIVHVEQPSEIPYALAHLDDYRPLEFPDSGVDAVHVLRSFLLQISDARRDRPRLMGLRPEVETIPVERGPR